jgi:iron complex outermembrane recepter protein
MFKLTRLTSAMLLAFASQGLFAQESQETDDNVEVIEVSGIRGSLNKALNIKRQSMNMVDAIVAEDIGKFPDNNVVEALQRVSGVQVTDRGAGEVSTVSIRGLTDVTTTVNGRTIFTASGRSVALADIPASLLSGVDVYKSRSADLIESGIAGQIDIHTQRPFDFEGSKVVLAARGIYQELADKVDPNVSALLSNRWELDGNGEFGALLSVSLAKTNYKDQSVTPGAVVPFFTDVVPDGFVPYQALPSELNGETIWNRGTEAGLPFAAGSTLSIGGQDYPYVLSRDAIFASDFTGKRERPAVNLSLQWAPNDTSEYMFEAFYNGYRNESFNSLMFTFVDWWGSLGPNPSAGIELYDGTNMVKSRTVNDAYGFNSGDLVVGQTDSYVYALGGKWDLSDNLQVESEVVYQTSEYDETFFAMRTERVAPGVSVDFNNKGGLPALAFLDNPNTDVNEADLTETPLWNVAQLYDNGGYRKGDAVTFTVDGTYFADLGWIKNFKFGLRYDDRAAEEGSRSQDGFLGQSLSSFDPGLAYTTTNFFDGRADIPSEWVVANGHYINANADEFRTLYGFDKEVSTKNFEISEATTALYARADFETEVSGKKLDGQFGLRYVNVSTDLSFINEATGVFTDDSVSTSKLLPSLMVRYSLSDEVIARFAYGQTLRRPNFTDLNPNITYQEDVTNIGYGQGTGGNPNLDPTESTNIDFTLEWYFAPSSSLYGTIFQRDIKGLVSSFRNVQNFEGSDDIAAGLYIVSQPDNASDAKLTGLEVGLVYFPENLPEALDGLGIQTSLTSLDSSQEIPQLNDAGEVVGVDKRSMFGVSDLSYSAILIYEKDDFDMRLTYTWRDNFLNNYEAALFAGPLGVYRKPESSVDFQFSYNVSDDLVVTLDATNLTDEVFQSYYQYPETHNFGNAIYSRTFALGARYSF